MSWHRGLLRSLSLNNIVDLGGAPVATAPKPRTYEIVLNNEKSPSFGPLTGYLVSNGYIVCLLAEHGNTDSVVFLANQGDILYVLETDEVDDDA